MSDSKRATLITVGSTKSSNNNVNKTVRLTINLDESNESKYPELNYKELVTSEEFQRKKKLENGKTKGLDPFSDNDDDVEKVARKFEQKYGGKNNYGKKGRSKVDDFADIGAGYDENDSFIDNTDGYDEMIPPECDTFYGGFYINCGDLEFKSVPENQIALSDGEPGSRKNKRRISSSSSEESSESSSESSQDEKETKTVVNGAVDIHETEHRKKKNKKMDKKKPKKKQRTDSSAATSGKQTSDDNIPNEAESADSRTSDSVASKPAPSSENAPTSDSSRDVEANAEKKLPLHVSQIVEELESLINKHRTENPGLTPTMLQAKMEPNLFRLERVLQAAGACSVRRAAWARVARVLHTSRPALLHAVRKLTARPPVQTSTIVQQISAPPSNTTATTTTTNNKRKTIDKDGLNVDDMSESEKEQKIMDTLQRLKVLIDEKTPGMMATYNAECERVQEERKKLQIASASAGAPHVEKRLPKRRFPWCPRSRNLLVTLTKLAGDESSAASLLTRCALPLFPPGFVRLPTLLRQADLSKEIKPSEMKRQRVGSTSNPSRQTTTPAAQPMTDPITFPASLTVTTTLKSLPDKNETPAVSDDKDKKTNSLFGSLLNSFTLSKDLVLEAETRLNDKSKEDLYIPPNSIGSITITPVPNQNQNTEKKINNTSNKQKEPLLRVKSPAVLNEMVKNDIKRDKEKPKKVERNNDKQLSTPLHVDTSNQTVKKKPSPVEAAKIVKPDHGVSQRQIEIMRNTENYIPRPALVPVHHSPTFAKPDKRPPEQKKKKEILIMSDVDPLAEQNEPVCVDSDSDIEVIEETKSDSKVSEVKKLSNSDVPCTDKVTDGKNNSDEVSGVSEDLEEPTDEDLDMVFRNIREMKHSQEPSLVNQYGGVSSLSAQN